MSLPAQRGAKSRCLSGSGGHHGSGHHSDGPIYLDYSATTSVDPRAAESTQPIPDHAFWIGHKSDIAACSRMRETTLVRVHLNTDRSRVCACVRASCVIGVKLARILRSGAAGNPEGRCVPRYAAVL